MFETLEDNYEALPFYSNKSHSNVVRKYLLRILLVLGTFGQWFLLWRLWAGQPLPEILGDVNGLVPPYGVKPTLFQKEPGFDPLNASDTRWTELLPELGGGFVSVPNDDDYPLLPAPVRAPSDGTESFNVAVFHQLHCLQSIAGLVGELAGSTDGAAARALRVSRRRHIEHCFEYLRLALRCCGDATLEGQGRTVAAPGIDGFGSWHMCRDYESIGAWATEHRASDLRELPT